jgi:phage tail tape-measure protein
VPDVGALPDEAVEAPEVSPDDDGAAGAAAGDGADVVAGAAAAAAADESEGPVVVAVGVGFVVSPVGGFILSE